MNTDQANNAPAVCDKTPRKCPAQPVDAKMEAETVKEKKVLGKKLEQMEAQLESLKQSPPNIQQLQPHAFSHGLVRRLMPLSTK